MVNCEDNDEMLHKVAFNLCLHCLLRSSGTEIHHFIVLLSGRVLDSRPRDRRFEPHWQHCVVVLEQDTFILP